jgi:hypothetical protein
VLDHVFLRVKVGGATHSGRVAPRDEPGVLSLAREIESGAIWLTKF